MKTKAQSIADSLIEAINNKIYTEKLPSEKELSVLYKTTPVTAGKALNILKDDGIVARVPGRGTFIQDLNKEQKISLLLRRDSTQEYINLWQKIKKIIEKKFNNIIFEVNISSISYDKAIEQGEHDLYINFSFINNHLYQYFVPFQGEFDRLLQSNKYYFSKISFAHRENALLYGLPYTFSPMVIFVNKSLFEQNFNENLPTEITTAQLIDYAQRFANRQNQDKLFIELLGSANLFNWFSGALLNKNIKNIFELETVEYQQFLKVFENLYRESFTEDKSFFDGDFLFRYSNRQFVFKMNDKQSDVDFDVISIRCENDMGGGFASESLFIHQKCQNIDAAQKICNEIISDEVQTLIGTSFLGIPINKIAALDSVNNKNFKDYLFFDSIGNISAHNAVYSLETLEMFIGIIQSFVYSELSKEDFEQQMLRVFEYHKFADQSKAENHLAEEMFS
ncbi:GntR family transcriptional regulator [Lentisphaerota bacterium WC36G]|nr:extracellular solute-binding protein [Lentisphaerae bacterium WC36]